MNQTVEQKTQQFYLYPPVGAEDWRYIFASAQVRVLESLFLSKTLLADLANAKDFDEAVELLASTDYSLGQSGATFNDAEAMLSQKRTDARELFSNLIIDDQILWLVRAREDFRNLRLALRRKLTDKPIGNDYCNDGDVPADDFARILDEENYSPLPEYCKEAIEAAVLAYYEHKDIRQIDHAIDRYEAHHGVITAEGMKNEFLEGLYRIRIDLNNIQTMFRLKFTELEERNIFIDGGYVELDKFKTGLDLGFEAVAPLFFATPYMQIVEAAAAYFTDNESFLKLEQMCDSYMRGYLETAWQVTAGSQPIIAYLLIKEAEIRNVRLILTAKKNMLDSRLIFDRIGK
jgi:V/A-type H+-transporting ATPase subunit C